MYKYWITSSEIENFVQRNSRLAQEMLPELISRLIRTSTNKIDNINVQNIQAAGYDVTLTTGEQSTYFPAGKSVWELGTNENTLTKFKSDIKKRSKEPLGVDMSKTEFIFATLKIWNSKTSIEQAINEAKALYMWKSIRIIDAEELSRWLESCPAVAIWFSKVIGNHIDGITSTEGYWEDFAFNTNPVLTPECLLIEREHQSDKLLQWLESPMQSIIIKAESTLEATLFIIARIMMVDENQKSNLSERIIIVTNSVSWQEILDRANDKSIIIPVFPIANMPCPNDRNIIFPINRYDYLGNIPEREIDINLSKYKRNQFNKMLELLGYGTDERTNIVFNTKRSFLPLYRTITTNLTRKTPQWLTRENYQVLIPAMLVGSWNSTYDGDKRVIETLSGMTYTDYEKALHDWLGIEDAPIFNIYNNFYTVSIDEMWTCLYSKITTKDIENLEKVLIDTFGQIDPAFELPEEQRYLSNFYGKSHEFTHNIEHGLVVTLIMISKREDSANYFNISSTKAWVDVIVAKILESVETWQHWSTIAPSLPLLVEASPKSVLEKIERAVNDESDEFWKIFVPPKEVLWSRSYYTHILWALEKLVWDEDYAVSAVRIITAIGERNLEYKLTNTPNNSLYEIFCPWYPQNCLSIDERTELLKSIVADYPATGWELLCDLIPDGYGTCGQIARPRWREFTDRYSRSISQTEFYSGIDVVIDLCLQIAQNHMERWEKILVRIMEFNHVFDNLSKNLQNACTNMEASDILKLCDKLRHEISRHRKYRDSDWSAPEEVIVKWELLLNNIMPQDTLSAYEYLLNSHPDHLYPEPYDSDVNTDWKQERLNLLNIRKNAAGKIIEEYGQEIFFEFCARAKSASDWGNIISELSFNNQYDFGKLKSIREINDDLYTAILFALYTANGLEKLIDIVQNENSLTNDEIGKIMCCTHSSMEVWLEVEKMGDAVSEYYLENVRAFNSQEENSEIMEYYIDKLLQHKRPFSVIEIIAHSKYNNTQTVIKILRNYLELQDHIESDGNSAKRVQPFYIVKLFEKIYNDLSVDAMEVARLELSFINLFRFNKSPVCLFQCIAKMPEIFIEFISTVCKPDDDETVTQTEFNENSFKVAYEVIEQYNEIPGCNKSVINRDVFIDWAKKAKQKATELGFVNSFDRKFGKLLSNSPLGEDGIFPHEIIREYLESNSTPTLVGGFSDSMLYPRGVHNVTYGIDEENKAKKYKEDSIKIKVKYPKTSAILNRLSESYFSKSKSEQLRREADFSFIQ